MILTTDHLLQMGCPAVWGTHLIAAMNEYGITTRERAAHFLAQVAHESLDFRRFEESLYYSSPERILAVFKRLRHLGIEGATKLAKNPTALANRAYANVNGNGDELSGDGWVYKGRGIIQLTGRGNYSAAGSALGVDLIKNPDDAATPRVASRVAGWFWQTHGCNELADANDIEGITRKVNGPAMAGLIDRKAKLQKAKSILAQA